MSSLEALDPRWVNGAAAAAGLAALYGAWRGLLLWQRKRAARARLARLDAMSFRRLSSVVLPDGNGGLVHLDHLLLTPRGLLVVDERRITGIIFGSELMDDWTQMAGRGLRRTFPNPLRPLYDRLAAVRALAGEGIPVDGRVVFADKAQFPKGHPHLVLRAASFGAEFPAVDRNVLQPDARWVEAYERIEVAAQPSPSPSPAMPVWRAMGN
jgi:Nuclease-related domain